MLLDSKFKVIGMLTVLLMFSFSVNAFANTTFNNSLGSENISVTELRNTTRFLSVPENILLTNSLLDLSGFNFSKFTPNVSGAPGPLCTGVITDCPLCNDGNWDTACFAPVSNNEGFIHFNYTPISNLSRNEVKFRYRIQGANPAITFNLKCFNHTSSTFDLLFSDVAPAPVANITLVVPSECVDNTDPLIQLRFRLFTGGSTSNLHEIEIRETSTIPTNFTLFINNQSVFNNPGLYNTTNTSINVRTQINDFLSICTFISGFCQVPFIFQSATDGNIRYFNMNFNNSGFVENSITFNATSSIGKIESFSLNMTFDNNTFTPNVFFVYNGTEQTATTTDTGATRIYTVSRIVPSLGTDENYTFHFRVEDVNGSFNSTFNNQSVATFNISDCGSSGFSNILFTFTSLNEETQAQITATSSDFALNLFSSDRSLSIVNASGTNSSNPWSICIDGPIPEGVRYSADLIIQYEANGFAKEFFNIFNGSITNTTGVQSINLYDLNLTDSTEFRFTFTGDDAFPVENALVFVNRKYIEDDLFRTVELPATDSEGQTTLHLVQNEVIYNIIVVKNGVTLGVFNNLVAFCNDPTIGDCEIVLSGADSTTAGFDYDEFTQILFSAPTFTSATREVTFAFASIDGTTKTVVMEVTRANVFGNTSVCSSSLTASSGTLVCSISNNINDSTLIVNVLVDGVQVSTLSVEIESSGFGDNGFLLFFLIVGSIVLMIGDTKEMVLLGTGIGIVGGLGYGFTNSSIIGTTSAFMWIIVLLIAGVWKLNKDRAQ